MLTTLDATASGAAGTGSAQVVGWFDNSAVTARHP
jgi:hypothetical protein